MALPELFANSSTPGSAVAVTTLAAAVTSTTATTITTAAAAPAALQAAGQFRITIDGEIMIVTGGANTTTWTVTRGAEGSTAATHLISTSIWHRLTAGALGGQSDAAAGVPSLRSLGSSATQAAPGTGSGVYAPLASPTFTGTPAAPTAVVNTNTTQVATTAYVMGQGYAPLASPSFTGSATVAANLAVSNGIINVISSGAGQMRLVPGTPTNWLESGNAAWGAVQDLGIGGQSAANVGTLTIAANTTKFGGNLYAADAGTTLQTTYYLQAQVGSNRLATNAGSFFASSDSALKMNVRTIDGALAKVCRLRGVRFRWKNGTKRGGRRDLGVIAQEVAEVFPELVGEMEMQHDHPKGVYAAGQTVLGMDKGALVGPLIEAVKELAERVESLEDRLASVG